jgi:hypothetical protein
MTLDPTVVLLVLGAVCLAAPLFVVLGFWVLLRSRPKATLTEAAEALATVIGAIRRGQPANGKSPPHPVNDDDPTRPRSVG